MKKEMTIPALKRKLAELERKELEQMICNLYKGGVYAEQAINVHLLGEEYERKLLEQYKERLEKIFFPANIARSNFSLPMAKAVVSFCIIPYIRHNIHNPFCCTHIFFE